MFNDPYLIAAACVAGLLLFNLLIAVGVVAVCVLPSFERELDRYE